MQPIKITAKITENGEIKLPDYLNELYGETVDILLIPKKENAKESSKEKIPTYICSALVRKLPF